MSLDCSLLTAHRSLSEWLAHLESLHPRGQAGIELGLDRVRQVKERLGLAQGCPLITVAGTNGKGSVCAMLERILLSAGFSVGVYTSPHLLRYNERVRVNGQEASDDALCAAFHRVEAARGDVPLTYFEFGTLAAWLVFQAAGLDAIVLEVGLGGRLDAVNVFDADCAIVTGIALDHMDYLGDTREAIGFEKAGIFRAGRPAIIGDPLPPRSLLDHAQAIGADLRLHGRDFGIGAGSDRSQWQFWSGKGKRGGLAYPGLRGANQLLNAAAVLAALECLTERLPVSMGAIRQGLITVELPGRFQVLPGRPAVVLDVAHNPQAAAVLADNLSNMGYFPETWAIVGMLGDKDIEGSLRHLVGRVDHWLPCGLEGPRAASADDLAAILCRLGVKGYLPRFASPQEAYAHARDRAGENDRIAVFGSFLTVAGVMKALEGR
jgi:dihydrofolate synthase/folylpolyglutamate synthase